VENMDMARNHKKAWKTLKQLNRDLKATKQYSDIIANQVTHVLLKNGKPKNKPKRIQILCNVTSPNRL